MRLRWFLPAIFLIAPHALATDIDGVQPAALDQPRINMLLRRAPGAPPLEAKEGKLTEGAFEWIVFDEPAKMLGLQLRKER